MEKMIAIKNIYHNGEGYKPGASFEVEADVAAFLVKRQAAIFESRLDPKPKPKPVKKKVSKPVVPKPNEPNVEREDISDHTTQL
jgi:hypothetical protein